MKELLLHMGHLLALRQLNRDTVAESLGMTRQNLIASVKGRRPLPKQYLPQLTKVLCLDDTYLLKTGHVHLLTIANADKQYDDCYATLQTFLLAPLKHIALLHGIGEKQHAFAYVVQDTRGVYVVLRNDEKTLAYIESNTTEPDSSRQLFCHASYQMEREITSTHFERLFREGITTDELASILKQDAKVWTWARICEKAESMGLSPEDIAKRLNLTS